MFRSPKSISQFVYTFIVAALFIIFTGRTLVVSAATPTVSINAPATAFVDEVILVDARLSTGVSRFPQADSRPSVTMDFGDGFTANLLASGHAYRNPGTYTITLTLRGTAGETASTQRTVVVSPIPAATSSNIQTLTNTGNAVTNATNLQTAINLAASRNSVEQEIVLPAVRVVPPWKTL